MTGSLLLDTNAVIAFFKGEHSVLSLTAPVAQCFVPSIVIGELLYGALHSARVFENTERIQSFAEVVIILACDRQTAAEYARIKHRLRIAGTPIPENDIWIAALAVQYNLTILSKDSHVDLVTDVVRNEW